LAQTGAMSDLYPMWPRETTARSGDIVGGIGSPLAKANVFGFCSGALPFVPKRKTRSLWLHTHLLVVPAVKRGEPRGELVFLFLSPTSKV
jgi:hypothetical protein